ncbi:hypothetical protein EJ06DRAFT_533590 [Trichodelitschia bisporula]|uniref:Uncharacterized protein n=1 Tax=Trichodelitschia bisporula TaxID=703511 RepID=A0A6G1HLT1_9PEZI|nr:hypothetical protein EJ06DRAFT_533590 [Trichodelitschia bisporula]
MEFDGEQEAQGHTTSSPPEPTPHQEAPPPILPPSYLWTRPPAVLPGPYDHPYSPRAQVPLDTTPTMPTTMPTTMPVTIPALAPPPPWPVMPFVSYPTVRFIPPPGAETDAITGEATTTTDAGSKLAFHVGRKPPSPDDYIRTPELTTSSPDLDFTPLSERGVTAGPKDVRADLEMDDGEIEGAKGKAKWNPEVVEKPEAKESKEGVTDAAIEDLRCTVEYMRVAPVDEAGALALVRGKVWRAGRRGQGWRRHQWVVEVG